MAHTIPLLPLRDRIKDLNIKAYYLLVALSFIYRASSTSHSLKWAFTLTAFAAVFPVQDYITSSFWLEMFRALKVIALTLALGLAIWWVWTAATTPVSA